MIRKIPGVNLLQNAVDDIKFRTRAKVQSARNNVVRGGILLSAVGSIVWISIFAYVVFYYTYIPATAHIRPVHLQFKQCKHPENSLCTYPSAHVELTRRQQLLMMGQRYRVSLDLEMPESETNRHLGMFMVCVDFRSKERIVTGHSCRSTMLHYRSPLLHALQTLAFAPFLVFGSSEEKQYIQVDLMEEFEDDKAHPVTDVYVEIQSRRIEVYSAKMVINAHFSGLKYLMYHYPAITSMVSVGIIISFLIFVVGMSWHHLSQDKTKGSMKLSDRLKAFSDEAFIYPDGIDENDEYFEGNSMSSDESAEEIEPITPRVSN